VLSTVLLVVNYLLVAVAALAFAGVGEDGIGLGNPAQAGDVLAGLGGAVCDTADIGKVFGVLLVLSVLTSAAAASQATIMPGARTTLSMASHGVLPKAFARVHPKYRHRWCRRGRSGSFRWCCSCCSRYGATTCSRIP
jgi:amino acid transporter